MTTKEAQPIRGFHIDLKAQTLRFSALCDVLNDAAGWGYNLILLEYQDKFPFEGELSPLASLDALTREEIAVLIRLCRRLGLEIVPLVQSVGHVYYVLRHEQFAHLGEDRGDYPHMHAFCPSDPGSFDFFVRMAGQVIAAHADSRFFHIGGDETRLSDRCARCGGASREKLLKDRYLACCDWVRGTGRIPVLWGDMLLEHEGILREMKGRAAVMDWDYEAVTQPFHKVQYLKDKGFDVLAAPAARSFGDPCFVPRPLHRQNCLQAVCGAQRAGAMGVVVTSWAVRRCPWPTTEPSLMAAAMAMNDPGAEGREMDIAFSEAHFGAADSRLAAVPRLLGDAARGAADALDLYTLGLTYPDQDVGYVEGYAERFAVSKQILIGNVSIGPAYVNLEKAADGALRILDLARPRDHRQKYRTELWRWAAETALFFSGYVPAIAKGRLTVTEIDLFEKRLLEMRRRDEALLSALFTDQTMASEHRARTGIHLEYLDSLRR